MLLERNKIGYWIDRLVFMRKQEKLNNYIYLRHNCEHQMKKSEVLDECNIKFIESKIKSMLSEITITKDNIHLYYEFMGDKYLEKYSHILDSLFEKRAFYIEANISTTTNFIGFEHTNDFIVVGLSAFGIKDTLKPIDEYIKEIKESSEYKEYVFSTIDDYQNRLTDKQKEIVIKHCEEYSIKPVICAWYDDKEDFNSDWVEDLNYSQSDADDLLAGQRDNKEEFISFDDGQIIRFAI